GTGLLGRRTRAAADPASSVCFLAVGKMLVAAEGAADLLAAEGVDATVWDARCVKPLDPAMIADAAAHRAVVTVEDGFVDGGAGSAMRRDLSRLALQEGRRGPATYGLGVPFPVGAP